MEDYKSFSRQSENYMCCCGKIHCKSATYAIAICCAVLCVIGFFIDYFEHFSYDCLFVYCCVFSAVIVLLLIGLRTEQPNFLIPYIFFAVISVILCTIGIFFSIWTLTGPKSLPSKYLLAAVNERESLHQYIGDLNLASTQRKVSRYAGFGSLVILSLAIPLFLYSARTVQICHQYLKDYKASFAYSWMNRTTDQV